MDLIDAAYATGHEYPGGVVALAARMGIPAAVLYNKLNPHCTGNHLTLRESAHITVVRK